MLSIADIKSEYILIGIHVELKILLDFCWRSCASQPGEEGLRSVRHWTICPPEMIDPRRSGKTYNGTVILFVVFGYVDVLIRQNRDGGLDDSFCQL